jgi:hypothetical protein
MRSRRLTQGGSGTPVYQNRLFQEHKTDGVFGYTRRWRGLLLRLHYEHYNGLNRHVAGQHGRANRTRQGDLHDEARLTFRGRRFDRCASQRGSRVAGLIALLCLCTGVRTAETDRVVRDHPHLQGSR